MAAKKELRKGFLWLLVLFLFFISYAGAETNPQPYDRVIIFGVDGAGALIREGNTPNFNKIFSNGKITYEARATVPTVSAPGWGAVFYGVPGHIHGMDNGFAEAIQKNNKLYPSIFKLTKEAYPDADVASFTNWKAHNWGMIERDCGIFMYPNDQTEPTKEEIVEHIATYLEETDPKLLFVFFGDLDTYLHNKGFGSKEYFEEMTRTDIQIGRVYDELVKRGLLENSLILFITDHGGTGGTHGGDSDSETAITFAAAGPRLDTQGVIEDMEIQDVAAIVLYALGIEQPENQTGRVPKGIFPGVGGGKRTESILPDRIKQYGSVNSDQPDPELTIPVSMAKKLVYYQNFDGELEGLSGEKKLSAGLVNTGLNMRNSYIRTGVKHSSKWSGMTIGFWFKDEGYPAGDAVFVTDKNWAKGYNKGFLIALNSDEILVNIGYGEKKRKDLFWNLPPDYKGKWVHCFVVFDQSTQTVSLYCDFVCVAQADMLPSKQSSWTNAKEIFAGQDITGKYQYWMNADMDDLIIFDQALTPGEIEKIRVGYESFFNK